MVNAVVFNMFDKELNTRNFIEPYQLNRESSQSDFKRNYTHLLYLD